MFQTRLKSLDTEHNQGKTQKGKQNFVIKSASKPMQMPHYIESLRFEETNAHLLKLLEMLKAAVIISTLLDYPSPQTNATQINNA